MLENPSKQISVAKLSVFTKMFLLLFLYKYLFIDLYKSYSGEYSMFLPETKEQKPSDLLPFRQESRPVTKYPELEKT